MGAVWFLLSLSALAPAPAKAVLVFPVDVHGSARPGLKDVLSDRVLSQTRMSGAFSRVVSTGTCKPPWRSSGRSNAWIVTPTAAGPNLPVPWPRTRSCA